MSDFELNKTSGTPGVSFKADTGDFEFTGYSIPQKVNEFYEPILNWLTEYRLQPAKGINLVMAMEYMDNASRSVFDQIFHILQEIQEQGKAKVTVTWFSKEGDEDMLSLGKRFENALSFPFTYNNL